MKKRGFGMGNRNGFGGKNHEGETIEETALRELSEEAKILLNKNEIKKIGMLHFFYKANPSRDQDVHIYSGTYDGTFEETEEMKPQWRDIKDIPYDNMREDDSIWLPKLIKKEFPIDMTFKFDEEGKLAEYR
ncbi:MAG: NUDIX domain-containing protein [candidate division SR1 bacterium]|nr:NUDIX domain-containing protein [candidate division SR1 bacterium]